MGTVTLIDGGREAGALALVGVAAGGIVGLDVVEVPPKVGVVSVVPAGGVGAEATSGDALSGVVSGGGEVIGGDVAGTAGTMGVADEGLFAW